MSIIIVKPIEKEKWHNKSGREDFARPVVIEALVGMQSGLYSTGLTTEDKVRLETLTGFDLSPNYISGKAHPFWNSPTAHVKLESKTNIFDTNRAIDEIKYKILKASDLVANSQKEYDEGKFPYAIFVIFDEIEEIEIKASKAAIKRKVIVESTKLTKIKKAEIIQILSNTSVRNQSDDFVDLKLDETIDKFGAEKVLQLMQRDKAKTSLHALLLEAIHKNVLRKDGTAIYYMDDQIGFDVESALAYFADPKNQTLKAQILEKIN